MDGRTYGHVDKYTNNELGFTEGGTITSVVRIVVVNPRDVNRAASGDKLYC